MVPTKRYAIRAPTGPAVPMAVPLLMKRPVPIVPPNSGQQIFFSFLFLFFFFFFIFRGRIVSMDDGRKGKGRMKKYPYQWQSFADVGF